MTEQEKEALLACPATPDTPCFCGCHRIDVGVQYAVLCPLDGKVRDVSAASHEQAAEWAQRRDSNCGRCHPQDGKHVVVSRPRHRMDRRKGQRGG